MFSRRHDASLLREAQNLRRNARNGSLALEDCRERLEAVLASPHWPTANEGVKVVGLLRAEPLAPRIAGMLKDRRQVGFIRRNAADSLAAMESLGDEARAALLQGLDDPYWEVRTSCLKALGAHGCEEATILPFLARKNGLFGSRWAEGTFEVRMAACEALGSIGSSEEAYKCLAECCMDSNWRVRAAAIEALVAVVRRGKRDPKLLEHVFAVFDRSCVQFTPRFPLSGAYNRATAAWDEQQ